MKITNLKRRFQQKSVALSVASAITLGIACTTQADTDAMELNIKSQGIGYALTELGKNAGVQIIFPQDVNNGAVTAAIEGQYTLAAALDRMLANTGLVYEFVSDDSVLIKAAADKTEGKVRAKSQKELLEEIIITAQRREQSIKDVPISIVAIGAEELEQRRIENFVDLGLSVPGISVEDTGISQRRLYMRGMANVVGSSPLVGVYLDDIPMSGGAAAQNFDMRTVDLERIEVLRGPQGTLYGQGSVGGTIRFITKKPELDRFGGSADMSASSTQSGSFSQQVQSVVNMPLVKDQLAIRIAGVFEHAGGWIDQPALAQKDINDENVINVRTKLLWRPNDAFEMDATAIVHRNNAGAAPISIDENDNYTALDGLAVTPSGSDDYEIYNLTLSYDFSGMNLLSSSSHTNHVKILENQNIKDFSMTYGDFALVLSDYRAKTYTQELRLSSDSNSAWQWTVGGIYTKADTVSDTILGFGPPFFAFPVGAVERERDSWGVFGESSFAVTDRLEVGAGVRYFEDDQDYTSAGVLQSESFDAVSPRFFVRYDVSDTVNVYSSVAKGFRSGGFNLPAYDAYGPEDSWTYEVGSKSTLWDGKLDADVALFFSRYEDFQSGAELIFPDHVFRNSGTVEIKGLEWSLTWAATDALSFGFDGSYLDTEFVEITADPLVASFAEGDSVDYIAKYQFSFSSTYNFEMSGVPGYLRLDYNKKDKTPYHDASSGVLIESDVISTLNLNMGWDVTENVSLGLFGKNLLNERGYTSPGNIYGTAPRLRPRTYGISVSMDF